MIGRCLLLHLFALGICLGETRTAVTTRLNAELKETYRYSPPVENKPEPAIEDEEILHLDPITVTAAQAFHEDLLKAARRAAEAEKATKFSPLSGGLLYSSRNGKINLGIWPKLIPMASSPVKKEEVLLSVDLLRVKW